MNVKQAKKAISKPAYEAIPKSALISFSLRTFEEFSFTSPYHVHPEYELTLILKGRGKRFVGNNMSDYCEGDLVLLGANLPHCWKTAAEREDEVNASSIVVQFAYDFLGIGFLDRSEMSEIRQLLDKSNYGVKFSNSTSMAIKSAIINLKETEHPFNKLIQFLSILQKLALSQRYSLLDQSAVREMKRPTVDIERISAVKAYIIENFQTNVSLDEAAQIAMMSTTAFCKYFKKITKKTFIETVNEYRINHAARLLIRSDKPIVHVCFDSGFADTSHFFKTFKKMRGYSPLKYRRKFIRES
jgi:AraC-like DNA-binding protein